LGQKVYDTRQLIVSSSSREHCFARKNNPDFGVFAGLRIDLDRPRMLLHDDVVSDGEAKTCALSSRFCREEGIEHLLLYLRRNADAVIANPDLNFVPKVFCRRR